MNKTQTNFDVQPMETKWLARAKLKSDDFYKTSLRFGSNIDLKPEKNPGAVWSLLDSTKTIQIHNEPDFIANAFEKHRNRTGSTAGD